MRAWKSDVLHPRRDCAYLAQTRDFELMTVLPDTIPPHGIAEWRICARCGVGGRVGVKRPAPPVSARLDI